MLYQLSYVGGLRASVDRERGLGRPEQTDSGFGADGRARPSEQAARSARYLELLRAGTGAPVVGQDRPALVVAPAAADLQVTTRKPLAAKAGASR